MTDTKLTPEQMAEQYARRRYMCNNNMRDARRWCAEDWLAGYRAKEAEAPAAVLSESEREELIAVIDECKPPMYVVRLVEQHMALARTAGMEEAARMADQAKAYSLAAAIRTAAKD